MIVISNLFEWTNDGQKHIIRVSISHIGVLLTQPNEVGPDSSFSGWIPRSVWDEIIDWIDTTNEIIRKANEKGK